MMELFAKVTMHREWPGQIEAGAIYDRLADQVVEEIAAPPATATAWRGRIARVRPWFLREEEKRRAISDPIAVEIKGYADLPGGVTLSGSPL